MVEAAPVKKRMVLWFRNNLRLRDNYIIKKAIDIEDPKEIIPIFFFDKRFFNQKTKYGTYKIGAIRA